MAVEVRTDSKIISA